MVYCALSGEFRNEARKILIREPATVRRTGHVREPITYSVIFELMPFIHHSA